MAIGRKELIKKYIEFFKKKNHKEIKNSSLVPENDPTVLFTTAGMHPLVPYLLGESHPSGKKLVNVQRCIRTQDIDCVGDTTHHTFFEMLGNWSLGDYFKEEAIKYSYEFLTKELYLSKERLAFSVFGGDKREPKVPIDKEAAKIWESLGIQKERIAFLEGGIYESKFNWWGPAGTTGPCGPDTEMFYWKPNKLSPPKKFDPSDENWVEIWNDVLMQYNKDKSGNYNEAKQKNIDTGMGVERTVAILNGLEDNYLADMWKPIIEEIERLSKKNYSESERIKIHMRIIADHIKASVFIINDGVVPRNSEQGYVLRRLIRRGVRYLSILGIKNSIKELAEPVFKIYNDYEHLQENKERILQELEKEEETFKRALDQGIKKAKEILGNKISLKEEKSELLRNMDKKMDDIMEEILDKKSKNKDYSIKKIGLSKEEIDKALVSGEEAFLLYQSYGFPKEMLKELAVKERLLIDLRGFQQELKKHQELSRTASAGMFKAGLADDSVATTRLHTATHMLNQALRTVLKDNNIEQKGSNITPERLRFDFNFPRKLTDKELKEIEDLVNSQIKRNLEMSFKEMAVEEAKKIGAIGVFGHKYGEKVKVYTLGDFSKEICGGPHVKNTSEMSHFKIIKEESSSLGVRRIKAILE